MKCVLLMKFLQTKPQVENMNINYYDISYPKIKIRDEKEIVDNKYESGYINFKDIVPNHNISLKTHGTKLR